MELLQLVKECKRKGVTAQKCLYDRFTVSLFLLCRRYLKNDADAEEILHNGFLKIFLNLQHLSFTTDAAFIAWMRKIMVNECLQELRKRNSFLIVADEAANDIQSDDDIYSVLSANEIYTLITQIPLGYRTVFNLYVIEGYTHPEIAALLNVSEGTSKSQLSKAKKALQQLLTQNHLLYAGKKAK